MDKGASIETRRKKGRFLSNIYIYIYIKYLLNKNTPFPLIYISVTYFNKLKLSPLISQVTKLSVHRSVT